MNCPTDLARREEPTPQSNHQKEPNTMNYSNYSKELAPWNLMLAPRHVNDLFERTKLLHRLRSLAPKKATEFDDVRFAAYVFMTLHNAHLLPKDGVEETAAHLHERLSALAPIYARAPEYHEVVEREMAALAAIATRREKTWNPYATAHQA